MCFLVGGGVDDFLVSAKQWYVRVLDCKTDLGSVRIYADHVAASSFRSARSCVRCRVTSNIVCVCRPQQRQHTLTGVARMRTAYLFTCLDMVLHALRPGRRIAAVI